MLESERQPTGNFCWRIARAGDIRGRASAVVPPSGRRLALAALGISVMLLGAVWALAGSYMAQHERLGIVRFPISCSWQSQGDFTTATALLHLFRFAEAEDVYRSLIRRDPDCAIGYWGIAMSRLQNPLYALPSPEDQDAAREALTAARIGRTASSRERAYLAAAATLFEARMEWRSRVVAYAAAMERLAAEYPDDREAQIFDALALNMVGGGTEKTKAAELLLLAFSQEPDHTGIDHYLTYCLGHAAYQPKPFARAPEITSVQRVALTAFSLFALCALGLFAAFTADMTPYLSALGERGHLTRLLHDDG